MLYVDSSELNMNVYDGKWMTKKTQNYDTEIECCVCTHSLLLASRLRRFSSSTVMPFVLSHSCFSCSKARLRSSNSRICISNAYNNGIKSILWIVEHILHACIVILWFLFGNGICFFSISIFYSHFNRITISMNFLFIKIQGNIDFEGKKMKIPSLSWIPIHFLCENSTWCIFLLLHYMVYIRKNRIGHTFLRSSCRRVNSASESLSFCFFSFTFISNTCSISASIFFIFISCSRFSSSIWANGFLNCNKSHFMLFSYSHAHAILMT